MKKYTLFLLLVTGLCSCDGFLTVRPKSQINEKDLFSTSEGCEEAIYGVYASMGAQDLYGKNLRCGNIEVMGQAYEIPGQNNATHIARFNMINDTREYMGKVWTEMYKVLGHTNNIISAMEENGVDSYPLYNLYMGEALGTRAFLLYDLVRMFGPHVERQPDARGVPYVRRWTVGVTPFSTVKEVYDYVIADLKASERFLLKGEKEIEAKPSAFTRNRYLHFNLQAAQATLARVYWMKGDLDSAYIYADKVIKSGVFSLEKPSNIGLMHAGVVGYKETVFGIFTRDIIPMYKQSFLDISITAEGYPPFLARADWDILYKAEANGNEYRLQWFRNASTKEGEKQKMLFMKFFTAAQANTEGFFQETGDGVAGFGLITLPEMYLIAAEALLEKDPAKALDYFDTFIASRGLTKFADRTGDNVKELTLAEIYKERTKEFIGDGQEFFAMKKLLRQIIPDRELTDEDYTFVIPDSEFDFREDEEKITN